MNSQDYVSKTMWVAVDCLCGEGSFMSRLENATISALVRLKDDDVTGELAADLQYVLQWTKGNMEDGRLKREPDEHERSAIVKKMLHVLIETTPR